jgi:hypothetical protein
MPDTDTDTDTGTGTDTDTDTGTEIATRRQVIDRLRRQAPADPFYGTLMNRLADDIAAGGEGWRPFRALAGVPLSHNLPLRVFGAAHRLALWGEATAYAARLPSCGGDGDADAAWPALLDLAASGALDEPAQAPVQTNEPARTTSLLPGLGVVATDTKLPLRLLELGSSAGLLLRVDRYHHALGGRTWGPGDSPVRLRSRGAAPLPPLVIAERRGCDPNPLDPVTDRTLLLSFVWPTAHERFERLAAALRIAQTNPVTVDRAGAARWLHEQLADPVPGLATVVFHSIVWQYLDPAEQTEVAAAISAAGGRATTAAPLAWLRLEPHPDPERGAELRLTTWPSGRERRLALCDYHGRWLRWDRAER